MEIDVKDFDKTRQEIFDKIQWCKEMFENTQDGYYYGLRVGYEHALYYVNNLIKGA